MHDNHEMMQLNEHLTDTEIMRAIRYLDPDLCAETTEGGTGTLIGIGIALLTALTDALTYITFMFGTFESTTLIGAEHRLSQVEVGEFFGMYENREQSRHSKCTDNAETFFYRPRCKRTDDDTGTVFGICVSLLIVFAGTFGYIICVSLLITLVRVLVPLADFLKMQAFP